MRAGMYAVILVGVPEAAHGTRQLQVGSYVSLDKDHCGA
jgi:hypothetical protein